MTNKLKAMIIKRAREQRKGFDIEGDIFCVFDKIYHVNIINDEVWEIK
jgi:hypothetical protein